jgi:hypothetical protein
VKAIPATPEDYGWICSRMNYAPGAGFRAMKVVDSLGEIVAMSGYDNWTPNACQIHVAAEARAFWCKSTLRAAFEYPFVYAEKGMVYTVTPSTSRASLKMNYVLGFKETHRIKDGWAPGVDLVINEMRKEDCRWIKERA